MSLNLDSFPHVTLHGRTEFVPNRGCSSVWLERRPVTPEAAGSSPVTPASMDLGNSIKYCFEEKLSSKRIRHATWLKTFAGNSR